MDKIKMIPFYYFICLMIFVYHLSSHIITFWNTHGKSNKSNLDTDHTLLYIIQASSIHTPFFTPSHNSTDAIIQMTHKTAWTLTFQKYFLDRLSVKADEKYYTPSNFNQNKSAFSAFEVRNLLRATPHEVNTQIQASFNFNPVEIQITL